MPVAAVRRVAVSPDRQVVAAASGKKLLVWKVSGDAEPAIFEHPERIVCAVFSPTGEQLATATDDDAKAYLFEVEAGEAGPPRLRQVLGPVTHKYRGLKEADGWFTRPPVFADGSLVTVHEFGASGAIKWYDTTTGTELATTKLSLLDLRELAASPDGNLLALAKRESVSVDTTTRQPSSATGNALALAFSTDSKFFASSGIDLEVHRVQPGKLGSRVFPMVCKGGQAAFSNDGKFMAVLNRGLTQVWRLPADTSLDRKMSLDGRSSWVAFSSNGRYVAPIGKTAGLSSVHTIQVRESATGKPAGKALGLGADLVAAGFSPDGELMATVTGLHGEPAQLRIWNWQRGSLVCEPVRFDSEPVWTCFAPDGKAVAVHCMDGQAFLIDPNNGRQLLHLNCKVPREHVGTYPWMSGRGTIGFSHDGKTLLTWGAPIVQAWDRDTGRERWSVTHQQNCWALAESPDGQIVATGSYDRFLHFWDAATGNQVHPPIEHPDQILTVAFSPDGRLVGTSCLDWQTRVWEVVTGKLAYAMTSNAYLTDVRFTPDNRFAINASAVGLQVWDSQTGYPISQMYTTLTGGLPSLDISSDGHWVAIAGIADSYAVVDLQKLTEVADGLPEEALHWTELLSNSRVNGSTIVNLTRTEWLERWRQYRQQHPEFRPLEEPTKL